MTTFVSKTGWVAAILVATAFGQEGSDSKPTTGIPWRADLDLARAEAARDGRPLCVVFRCEA
jgi:hypothetical protein